MSDEGAGSARTSPRRRAPLALARQLLPCALILVLLTGCLFDSTPKTPAPPTPTATPRPTATATARALPIPQPTAPATAPVAPTAPAAPTAPLPAIATPDVRAAGQILYLSTAGGRRDIASVEANGVERRVLVAGTYDAPVWSPDGGRFAAYGATVLGGRSDQLAVFDPNGRPLARFALAGQGVGDPLWSPDGRALLSLQRDPAETSGARSAWVADEDGLRPFPLPDGAIPWRWTPDGRLSYLLYANPGQRRASQSNPLAIWSVAPDGSGARKEAEGAFAPLGWSPNGQTLYAFDGLLPESSAQAPGPVRATTLSAINRYTGSVRTLVRAETIAGGGRGGTAWFEGGAISPVGEIALWLGGVGPPGTPAADGQSRVALVDERGQVVAVEPPRRAAATPTFSWSAGGLLVAYAVPGGEIRILSPNGNAPLSYPIAPAANDPDAPPSWSPDSRWVVTGGPGGLTLAAVVGDRRTITLIPDANISAPAWRPAALR